MHVIDTHSSFNSSPMIVMKFGGTAMQDEQAVDRFAALVHEYNCATIFPSPELCPITRQVSGHEFTRAVQPKRNLGFSPCHKTPQGLKAKLLEPQAARMKSCPDTCRGQRNGIVLLTRKSPSAVLRASVSPWWGLSR